MIIGLTGGIASGKTVVSDYLKNLGYPVVDADLLSREVMAQPETLAAVRAAFGDGVFCADGSLDRAALARRVFSDPQARQRLDAITHPAIEKLAQARFAEYGGAPLVFFVVPLLYESGMDAICGLVAAVIAVTMAALASLIGALFLGYEEPSLALVQARPVLVAASLVLAAGAAFWFRVKVARMVVQR